MWRHHRLLHSADRWHGLRRQYHLHHHHAGRSGASHLQPRVPLLSAADRLSHAFRRCSHVPQPLRHCADGWACQRRSDGEHPRPDHWILHNNWKFGNCDHLDAEQYLEQHGRVHEEDNSQRRGVGRLLCRWVSRFGSLLQKITEFML